MPSTEMKQYRGTEVRVAKENGPCYVAHCDRTKGITIHDENDDEVWCLSREEFLERREYREKNRVFREIFSQAIADIEAGFVKHFTCSRGHARVIWYTGECPSATAVSMDCAFK